MSAATILSNGDLMLTAGNATRAWLAERQRDGASEMEILWEALEPYWANGSFEPFSAEDANPFVGLSSAPCIAEAMIVHDSGSKEIDGRFWAFTDYMVRDPIADLKCKGRVVFALVE